MSPSVNHFIQVLRLREATMLSGFVVIGCVFGVENIDSSSIANLGSVLFISIGIVSSLYSLNAYSDSTNDETNPRLNNLQHVSRSFFIWYFAVSLPLFLSLSFALNHDFGLLMGVMAGIGTLYSIPRFGFKNIPLLGTVAHFLFSVTAFNAGYAAFQGVSQDSIHLSCYFGLVFSGGHLHHQAIDYESDLKSSVKTLAVWWGVAKTEFGSLILFTLAAIIWLRYFNLGMIGNEEFVPLVVAYLIQAATFIRYRNRLYQDRIDYRSGYRFVYFSAFVLVAILKLWKL